MVICYKCLARLVRDCKRHGPSRLVLDNVWLSLGYVTSDRCHLFMANGQKRVKGAEKSDFQHRDDLKTFSTSSPQVLLSSALVREDVLPSCCHAHTRVPSLLPSVQWGFQSCRLSSGDKVTGFPPKLCLPLQNTWWKRKKGWVNEQINTGFDFTVLIYDSKSIILRRVGRICSFEDLNVHYMCFCNLYS